MRNPKHASATSGFTLLEVIITLTILVALIMAVAQLLRTAFDIRLAVSADGRITQNMNSALQRISDDLAHAYLIPGRDLARTGGANRTVFKILKEANGDSLTLTYMGHRSIQKNARESEFSYVVYQLKPSDQVPGRSNLYRGEYPRIPEDAAGHRELPPLVLFATNIATFQLDSWLGDDWSKDSWDSTRGDKENKLPALVRITLRGWADEPQITEIAAGVEAEKIDEHPSVHYSTIAYLPLSVEFGSIKTRMSSFRL